MRIYMYYACTTQHMLSESEYCGYSHWERERGWPWNSAPGEPRDGGAATVKAIGTMWYPLIFCVATILASVRSLIIILPPYQCLARLLFTLPAPARASPCVSLTGVFAVVRCEATRS